MEKQTKKKQQQEQQQQQQQQKYFSFISNFQPSLLQFSFFSSQFSPLFPFFLPSFFPKRQHKIPGRGHSASLLATPPLPRLLRHCSPVASPI